MLMLRKFHLYLGTLFAPAVIFFAFSGIFQVLGLHEAEEAAAVQPPRWIVTLASIHKDQRLTHPKPPAVPGPIAQMRADHAGAPAQVHPNETGDHHVHAGDSEAADPNGRSQTLLKAFAVVMALGLIASAGMGIMIAVSNPRTRRAATIMLLIGMLLPLGLLAL